MNKLINKFKKCLYNKNNGMSLIELMIVVVVMGIIFVYTFLNIGANTEKANYSKATEDLNAITIATAIYAAGINDFETINTSLGLGTEIIVLNKYLSKPLKSISDPFGKGTYTIIWGTGEGNTKKLNIMLTDGITEHTPKTYPDGRLLSNTLDFTNKE